MSDANQTTPATAADLHSLAELSTSFVRRRSSQLLIVLALTAFAIRIALVGSDRSLAWHDAAAMGAVIVLIGPVEWLIHRSLFHSPQQSWRRLRLGFGRDHQAHHESPDQLDTLFLSTWAVALLTIGLSLAIGLLLIPFAALTGLPILTTLAILTTTIGCGLVAMIHYEWVHLLAHGRYRPRTRYYRRLARNHRLHHFRDERFWLGVTTNTGDRLFGTMVPNGVGRGGD